jgi:hypothetical protein
VSSAASSNRRHANERALLEFTATQHSSYVQQTVTWLKREYPDSVDTCLPQLRKQYKTAKAKEDTAAKRLVSGL